MWRYGKKWRSEEMEKWREDVVYEDVNYVPKEELISLMRAQTLPTSIAGITDFSENLLSTVWTGGLASPMPSWMKKRSGSKKWEETVSRQWLLEDWMAGDLLTQVLWRRLVQHLWRCGMEWRNSSTCSDWEKVAKAREVGTPFPLDFVVLKSSRKEIMKFYGEDRTLEALTDK